MEGIAVAGEKIVNIMLNVGYYVTLISGVGSGIQHLTKKDFKGALTTILGFGGAYAALYALRWLLDLVKVTFG